MFIENNINLEEFAKICVSNEKFIHLLADAIKKVSVFPACKIIGASEAKIILGGISDRTFSKYRKKYPEMIVGSKTSRKYYRETVEKIAENSKKRR